MTDIIYQHRIFPRAFAFMWMWLIYEIFLWYTSLPDPTNGQSGFAGAIITASAGFFKFYVETGSKYGTE